MKTLLGLFLLLPLLFQSHASAANLASVQACLLLNLNTGKILYQKNADKQIPPASLTKIMTMFLALDAVKAGKLSLNQKIGVSREAARTGGSAMRLAPGEKVPLIRLLSGMAVASGNDAAVTVASKIGGSSSRFTRMMNSKAKKLGMTKTVFKNPTGLPAPGQKTTARDLMTLCRAYLKTHPSAKNFHKMKFYMHKGFVARNTNPLLGTVKGVDGLKTGWTVASGYNLIVTAKRGKIQLLAIILGGRSKEARDNAAKTLLEAGFKNPRDSQAVRKTINGR